MSATSPSVTTFEPDDFIGKLKTSSLLSKTLGISTANLPDPVSWNPAGIRTLFERTAFPISSSPTPSDSSFGLETTTSSSSSGTPSILISRIPGIFSSLS